MQYGTSTSIPIERKETQKYSHLLLKKKETRYARTLGKTWTASRIVGRLVALVTIVHTIFMPLNVGTVKSDWETQKIVYAHCKSFNLKAKLAKYIENMCVCRDFKYLKHFRGCTSRVSYALYLCETGGMVDTAALKAALCKEVNVRIVCLAPRTMAKWFNILRSLRLGRCI